MRNTRSRGTSKPDDPSIARNDVHRWTGPCRSGKLAGGVDSVPVPSQLVKTLIETATARTHVETPHGHRGAERSLPVVCCLRDSCLLTLRPADFNLFEFIELNNSFCEVLERLISFSVRI